MGYEKRILCNQIREGMISGNDLHYIYYEFMGTKMKVDLHKNCRGLTEVPSPADIKKHLLSDGAINAEDCWMEKFSSHDRLHVRMSPYLSIDLEPFRGMIHVHFNNCVYHHLVIDDLSAKGIARWIVLEKQKIDSYQEEWDALVKQESKKLKAMQLAKQAIMAIVDIELKAYPGLQYDFFEQKRRMRISVKLPNSRLGVYVDAWWGKYKQELPKLLSDLKILIETHQKTSLKDFYICR